MVSQVLHDTYDRYARCCLAVAVGLWLLGLAFQFLSLTSDFALRGRSVASWAAGQSCSRASRHR